MQFDQLLRWRDSAIEQEIYKLFSKGRQTEKLRKKILDAFAEGDITWREEWKDLEPEHQGRLLQYIQTTIY